MPWQARTEKCELEQESNYYRAHLPEWMNTRDEHVLIHGPEHFGFFATRNAALEEGFGGSVESPFSSSKSSATRSRRPMMWVML